jgi:hypothetical protein
VFSFGHILNDAPSQLEKVGYIFITLFLSMASYFIIEKRFRYKVVNKKFLVVILFSSIFIVVANTAVILGDGLKQRFSFLFEVYENNEFDNRKLDIEAASYLEHNPEFENNNKTKVLFVGDSNARDMANVMLLNSNLFKSYQFTKRESQFNTEILFSYNDFHEADVLVISMNFTYEHLKPLEKFIMSLKRKEKKIVLLSKTNKYKSKKFPLQTPFDMYVMNNLSNRDKVTSKDLFQLKKVQYKSRINTDKINFNLYKIAEKYNIIFLNKNDFLCDEINKECDVLTDKNKKIYYDDHHYTLSGAKYLGGKIFKSQWFRLN